MRQTLGSAHHSHPTDPDAITHAIRDTCRHNHATLPTLPTLLGCNLQAARHALYLEASRELGRTAWGVGTAVAQLGGDRAGAARRDVALA